MNLDLMVSDLTGEHRRRPDWLWLRRQVCITFCSGIWAYENLFLEHLVARSLANSGAKRPVQVGWVLNKHGDVQIRRPACKSRMRSWRRCGEPYALQLIHRAVFSLPRAPRRSRLRCFTLNGCKDGTMQPCCERPSPLPRPCTSTGLVSSVYACFITLSCVKARWNDLIPQRFWA